MDNVRVVSHWLQLFEGLEYSPQAFYAAVEPGLAKRQIPDAQASRVEFSESGLLTGKREYLRVKRFEHRIDICAAPFGSGFFVSWWLVKPTRKGLLYALLFVIGVAAVPVVFVTFGVMVAIFGFFLGSMGTMTLVLAGIAGLGYAIRRGFLAIEDDLLAVPILGAIYDWVFKPFTYYRIDTADAFQTAVHQAFLEVVDGLTNTKGIRALSESERKPILREFYGR